MADAAGMHDSQLSKLLSEDEGFRGLVNNAHAFHALESLGELRNAQKRGDVGAAKTLLEKGPYASEYGSQAGGSSGGIQVTINIANPTGPNAENILDTLSQTLNEEVVFAQNCLICEKELLCADCRYHEACYD